VKIIGLTGGIAMGKSTAASAFRRAGIRVFDADATVRALQAPGGAALPAIAGVVPGAVTRDASGRLALDRAALRAAVLGNPAALARLEAVVHPLVRARERSFLAAARRRGDRLVVLDVPLLFESRGAKGLDLIVAVSAPRAVQRKRVLTRGLMSAAQLDAVLARQWPDARRRRFADKVVPTGLSRHHAQAIIRRIVKGLRTA
jgi:dephospho-CoA kinase